MNKTVKHQYSMTGIKNLAATVTRYTDREIGTLDLSTSTQSFNTSLTREALLELWGTLGAALTEWP